ncbi:hypothetical protein COZ40_00320 [Candidatus Roizmanbacteria bacterium CG_4_10_14_3_um_filter_39_13]|uniref:Cupin type-2 domain-containing protein n=3 Tax=Candidatus Roizmaniibacteriota TaxID=1752723 RepID=A0A2H0KM53_9BACT|nr:MAG: hypothetical protein COV87_03365 [Candidatus Roizmanbacteria bacterium CG11_big_fil_rev_8_21_14_0_20_37_16]PIV70533.1 MAG: hypothetical protein COW57_04810 [Candidatus Roizmanbacteria bacterium CG17_big_fil_post_rev_8_21_14_2_50_39_7]PIX68993.1 MAG: hypothetical protein COZ40_00320 [Candidatus Roizmanbacteria bacterium CG_4_10_14_3_um_filter_39_13]
MNITSVIEELKKKYPKKRILLNNRQNCTEILCEIDPTSLHPNHSIALAIIDKTITHYHTLSEETYKVVKGVLSLSVDGKKLVLNEGQTFVIKPGLIHEATGNETWVQITSKPGWKQKDHHIVK